MIMVNITFVPKTNFTVSQKVKMMETILYYSLVLLYFSDISRLKPACFAEIIQAESKIVAPGMGFEPMRTVRSTGSQGPRVIHSAIPALLF